MGKRASTFLMIGVVAVLMIAAIILINREMIFQEGNPFPVAGGIWRVVVGGEAYAEIKAEPATWVTRTEDAEHGELIAYIENKYSVKLKEKTDNDYLFEGGGAQLKVLVRQYSRNFQIWELTQ